MISFEDIASDRGPLCFVVAPPAEGKSMVDGQSLTDVEEGEASCVLSLSLDHPNINLQVDDKVSTLPLPRPLL